MRNEEKLAADRAPGNCREPSPKREEAGGSWMAPDYETAGP